MKTTIPKLRRSIRKVILETNREIERTTDIERDPFLAQAYEAGSEQASHDLAEGTESEVLRYKFYGPRAQEEYDAFLSGYNDTYYG